MISTYLANKIADWFARGVAFVPPDTHHIKLMTTVPNADNVGGVEAAGGGYAEQTLDKDVASYSAAATRRVLNADIIDFGTLTASAGTIRGYAVYDAASGGNLLWFHTYDDAIVTDADMSLKFPINQFGFQLT